MFVTHISQEGKGVNAVAGEIPRNIHEAIVQQICVALAKLDSPIELLAIVGSWGDTQDDTETLANLKSFNERGPISDVADVVLLP